MAKDELTGNMPTERMLSYFTSEKVEANVNAMVFEAAYNKATELFSKYH
jgi:hydroxymethylglutaryl-CoA lyase